MENLEVILSNFNKKSLNDFIYDDLNLRKYLIKSSHYYDSKSDADIEFIDIKDLEDILFPKGTGSILVEELELGIQLRNVLIVTSFDESTGDIVFNFNYEELLTEDKEESIIKSKMLINHLLTIKNKYEIPKIILGYEPADDEDNLLIEIDKSTPDYHKLVKEILNNIE